MPRQASRARAGAVVNIASVLGVAGSSLRSAHGASKAPLIQLTRTLASESADRGVRVNASLPQLREGGLTKKVLANRPILESILARTPMRRLAEMDEVVAPTRLLASDDTFYISGAALLGDGG